MDAVRIRLPERIGLGRVVPMGSPAPTEVAALASTGMVPGLVFPGLIPRIAVMDVAGVVMRCLIVSATTPNSANGPNGCVSGDPNGAKSSAIVLLHGKRN